MCERAATMMVAKGRVLLYFYNSYYISELENDFYSSNDK